MKTPEEMFYEWRQAFHENLHERLTEGEPIESLSKEVFLAGYKAAQQWISVSDRLPEVGQDVLVWYHGSCCTAYLQKVKSVKLQPPQFNNVEMFEWCFDDFEDVDVTHWMPLPAPPKEEK